MCVEAPIIHDKSFTEDICEWCQDGYHDDCDEWNDEPCACYNSQHLIAPDNREALVEKFLELARQGR